VTNNLYFRHSFLSFLYMEFRKERVEEIEKEGRRGTGRERGELGGGIWEGDGKGGKGGREGKKMGI
jgi:hypothetical protein